MVVLLGILMLAGYFTDRVGKKLMLKISAILMLFLVVPLFHLMNHHDLQLAFIGQLGLTVIMGCYLAPLNAYMVLSTPTQIRCTAIGLGYNLTLGVIGGLTPLAAAWLLEKTSNPISPAYLVVIASLITMYALFKSNTKIN